MHNILNNFYYNRSLLRIKHNLFDRNLWIDFFHEVLSYIPFLKGKNDRPLIECFIEPIVPSIGWSKKCRPTKRERNDMLCSIRIWEVPERAFFYLGLLWNTLFLLPLHLSLCLWLPLLSFLLSFLALFYWNTWKLKVDSNLKSLSLSICVPFVSF